MITDRPKVTSKAGMMSRPTVRPRRIGPLGRCHGTVDILRPAFGDGRDRRIVVRRQHIEGPPIGRVDERPVDIELVADARDRRHADAPPSSPA